MQESLRLGVRACVRYNHALGSHVARLHVEMLHPAAALHRECYMLHVTMVHGIMLRTEIYAARLHTRHISARQFLWAITCVSQTDAQGS